MLQLTSSTRYQYWAGYTRIASILFLCITIAYISGCGSGNTDVFLALQIIKQPSSQTVPLGSPATFTVTLQVDSRPIAYQWYENGTLIPGATSVSYVTEPVTLNDNDMVYSVTVSDTMTSLVSSPATLTIGPRSPVNGDLRFQQVGAQSTIHGYEGEEGTNLNYGVGYSFTESIGTPLSVGPGCVTAQSPYGCTWLLEAYSTALTDSELSVNYQADYLTNWNRDLASLNSTNSVLTGLDIEPIANAVGYSAVQGTSLGTFTGTMKTVPIGQLNADIVADGLAGNVATAITDNGDGMVSYVTYSWSANAGVAYDSTLVLTNYSGLASSAANLAAQGYIITAIGGDPQSQIMLIGTKVQGDTLPRSLLTVFPFAGGDLSQLQSQGYAVVGLVLQLNNSGTPIADTWIGEK
jgi:hypothetical protein